MPRIPRTNVDTSDSSATVSDGASAVDVVISGQSYAPGATVTVMGKSYTAVGAGQFAASKNSGLNPGTYPVVFEMIGDRKAYRVYADGEFYPIRQFGSADAIISKQRESRAQRPSTRAAASHPVDASDDAEDLELSVEAGRVLAEYVSLNRGSSQSKALSDLVVKHLGPEVERIRKAQEAIKQLPLDLLSRLADATEEKRAEILALLR